MLTYAWDGVPLPQEHGFPLRIHIPDIYGMKQPKWDMTIINADHHRLVSIGGISNAGAREISKVELQVDDSPWQEAALRTPLSHLTWVVWRYEWPFGHGKHTFSVRCYEGDGTPQIATQSPVEPSGATGLYNKTETCLKTLPQFIVTAFIYVSHCREKWKFSTNQNPGRLTA